MIKKIKQMTNDVVLTLSVVAFSLGFALFITSIIKIIEFPNPWITLVVGLSLMIFPIGLGIWEFKHAQKKFMHNLRKLKLE